MKAKVMVVAGARPNFMKIAPLMRELKKWKTVKPVLVHTGQHYDYHMSDIFFRELSIPKPDIFLNVGSGSHAVQTANIIIEFEKAVLKEKPSLVIVVGDVNSTLACSLVATKMRVPVAHVEAGLRSFDRHMPEEVNRLMTDVVSDYLFVSEESGLKNLAKEGIPSSKVFFAGNVMIDTLLSHMARIDSSDILRKLQVLPKRYAVVTLHRPSNVDRDDALSEVVFILEKISERLPVVYPIHPRTRKMLRMHKLLSRLDSNDNVILIDPLGYGDFIKLVKESRLVLTDSGGIQEETTVLRVPCLTLRDSTERPVTVKLGTNSLMKRDSKSILSAVDKILTGKWKKGSIPPLWDGRAAARIVQVLKKIL